MPNSLLRVSRQIHLYCGLLIAPSLLFFAFTGTLQMLSLHESAGTYTPPAWVASLAQLHKNATLKVSKRPDAVAGKPANVPAAVQPRPGSPAAPAASGPPQPGRAPVTLQAKQKAHLPLKIFFIAVALGLFVSTLSGIYMAYMYSRRSWVVTGWLLAGVVVPLLLTRF